MASAMQPWSAIRLSDPCRQGSALRLCGSQSCSALTPAKGLPFKGGLQIGCTPKGGAFFQKHHCKGQDRSRRPELGHAPRSGLFSQQGKNTDRRRQGASAHEGKSSSDAIREEGADTPNAPDQARS